MEKRKTFDTYEFGDRKFILTKFDPLLGNYILMQVMSYVMPFGISGVFSNQVGMESMPTAKMSKNDFIELQKDILSGVYEQLPGNRAPIFNDNGSYGINDVSMKLIVELLLAELVFNFQDFFEDGELKDTLGKALSFNPPTTPQ